MIKNLDQSIESLLKWDEANPGNRVFDPTWTPEISAEGKRQIAEAVAECERVSEFLGLVSVAAARRAME